jgi:hypothetical protein
MADEQKNTPAPAAQAAPAEGAAPKKNKKIRFFTPSELDEAIEKTKKNQGSLNSKYGRELLKQKELFTSKK